MCHVDVFAKRFTHRHTTRCDWDASFASCHAGVRDSVYALYSRTRRLEVGLARGSDAAAGRADLARARRHKETHLLAAGAVAKGVGVGGDARLEGVAVLAQVELDARL